MGSVAGRGRGTDGGTHGWTGRTTAADCVHRLRWSGRPGRLAAASSILGQQISLGSDSFDKRSWSEIFDDKWAIDGWKGSGDRMIWAVQMLPALHQFSLATGAASDYDNYFYNLAENLVAAGMGNSILRLGWEFNQRKFPWYAAGQSSNFVGYWRQIVTTMRTAPGANFEFVWNPSRGDNGPKDQAMGNFANYYPGDSYVDMIGMDVYDSAWKVYPGAAAEFQKILTQTYGLNWLANFAAVPCRETSWITKRVQGVSVHDRRAQTFAKQDRWTPRSQIETNIVIGTAIRVTRCRSVGWGWMIELDDVIHSVHATADRRC